jgi:hypothetical protein
MSPEPLPTPSEPGAPLAWNASDDLPEAPAPAPSPGEAVEQADDAPLQLRVFVERCGDPERDRRRLQRIYGTLISHPGQDHFSVTLVEGSRLVEVDFPDETTDYTSVADKLTDILGPDAIEIISR